jgi:hypothetical protein
MTHRIVVLDDSETWACGATVYDLTDDDFDLLCNDVERVNDIIDRASFVRQIDGGRQIPTAVTLECKFGHWGQHPTYTAEQWAELAKNNETRLSYWEWVSNELYNEMENEAQSDGGV